jgi:hypothetical protein
MGEMIGGSENFEGMEAGGATGVRWSPIVSGMVDVPFW